MSSPAPTSFHVFFSYKKTQQFSCWSRILIHCQSNLFFTLQKEKKKCYYNPRTLYFLFCWRVLPMIWPSRTKRPRVLCHVPPYVPQIQDNIFHRSRNKWTHSSYLRSEEWLEISASTTTEKPSRLYNLFS